MSDKVTRCPSCLVAFKVSQAQLQAANGLARCGACLTIFDARKQLTDLPQELEIPADSAATSPRPEDDFLIDDNFDPDDLQETAVSDSDDAAEDESPTPNDDSAEHGSNNKKLVRQFESLPEPLHLPVWLQDARQGAQGSPDDSMARKIDSAPFGADATAQQEFHSASVVDHSDSILNGTDGNTEEPDPYADLASAHTPLFDDDDGEDEVPGHRATQRNSPLSSALLRTGIVALGALALVAQYIYFNMDSLGKNVAQRPRLEKFCQVLPCELPALKDTSLIRSNELVVRTHPNAEGALLVSAVLSNEAPYQQPFPELQLVFQDLQGAVVAKRSFLPGEYLRGELSGAIRMPVGQPVRLELEILDPGETAVSFALYIL